MQDIYTSFEKHHGEIYAVKEGDPWYHHLLVHDAEKYRDFLKQEIVKSEKSINYFHEEDKVSMDKRDKYKMYLARLQEVLG